MATEYASGKSVPMVILSSRAAIDLSAAAADKETFIVPTGWSGWLHINRCFFHVTEVVGDATTPGVVTIDLTPSGGSETTIGTLSLDNVAVNTVQVFTPASTYEDGVALAAGDTIMIDHSTQASGGTVTGEGYVSVVADLAPIAR